MVQNTHVHVHNKLLGRKRDIFAQYYFSVGGFLGRFITQQPALTSKGIRPEMWREMGGGREEDAFSGGFFPSVSSTKKNLPLQKAQQHFKPVPPRNCHIRLKDFFTPYANAKLFQNRFSISYERPELAPYKRGGTRAEEVVWLVGKPNYITYIRHQKHLREIDWLDDDGNGLRRYLPTEWEADYAQGTEIRNCNSKG